MSGRFKQARRYLFWGLALVCVGLVIRSQVERADALGGGPDAFGYNWHDNVTYDFEQAASSLSMANDSYDVVEIGFNFEFYGETYNEVTVSSEGGLHFEGEIELPISNETLPYTEWIGIFPFWDDLNVEGEGDVYYDTIGSSPSRIFIAEWRGLPHYENNPPYYYIGNATFEVKLFEEDDSIEFHYSDVDFGMGTYNSGASATIGIADGDQGFYLEVSYNAASVSAGYAVRFESPGGCVDNDTDGWTQCDGDCDDTDSTIHPGAAETCDDGIDSNCDGAEDETADNDGDGYSNCDGDCDDSEPLAYPGNVEACDFLDNDCDGWVDNGYDIDGDGWTTCEGDCDDADGGTWPSAPELCDGVDSDCMDDLPSTEVDNDGDGYAECDGDCHDGSAATYPGAEEICDTQDNDCDPITDELGDVDLDGYSICQGDCNDGDAGMNPAQAEVCDKKDNDCNGMVDDNIDFDHDGYPGCGGADCEDYNAAIHPGAQEVPYDNIDQDCDGADLTDLDGDGFSGGPGQPDCMDDNAAVHPDAEENCEDGLDNNCDGAVDDEDETCLVSADDDDDDDCSCDATGDDRAPSVALLAVLAVLAIVRRRR